MNGLSGLGQRARQILSGFTSGQKTMTVIAVAALLLGGTLFFNWATKPSYQPLYSNLAASDAASITSKLTASHVPYQLADGGATILVPAGDVYAQRIAMASAGLPSNGVDGYSLLDKQGITTTQFQQNVDYQRAMEGELTKTIEAMQGVNGAIVHLVIPQQSLFSSTSDNPSASVLVEVPPTQPLTGEQVQSIVHLVSSAVQGMTPDQVTVADQNGNLLSAPGMDGQAAAAGDQRTQQTTAYETSMEQRLQQMVDSVVGPGNAVVRVNATLNFDATTVTQQQYTHDPKVPPLSQSTTKETYSGTGSPTGGTLGTGTGTTITGGAGKPNTYTSTTSSQDNAVGMTTTQSTSAPGSVQRTSVAVLLNSAAASPSVSSRISTLVSAAAGLQPAKGDTVRVDALPFSTTAAKAAAKQFAAAASASKMSQLMSLAKLVVVLLFVGLLLFFAIRRSRRYQRGLGLGPAERAELDEARRALLAMQARELEAGEPLALVPPQRTAADEGDAARSAVRDEIGALVERQPEEVAQLLRGWLADRRNG